jgi:3-hydroxyacyl-CoA dehydrogenase
MSEVVSYSKHRNIGLITVNNPPVNALSQAVRAGLAEATAQGIADDEVAALVIWCAGRTFMAGADIREFGRPPQAPHLPDVAQLIEDSPKPMIAAIHGTALGGGFEVALSCHFRVALASAKVGLPEVKLGILPGAGGTQRLPRLIGARAALDLIVSGTPMSAQQAYAAGAIDEVVDGDLQAAALKFAGCAVAERRAIRRVSSLTADRKSVV